MAIKQTISRNTVNHRIQELREIYVLELEGIAAFLNREKVVLYNAIADFDNLGEASARKLAAAIGVNYKDFVDPNFKLPKKLKVSAEMLAFMEDNKNVKSYFKETHSELRASWLIKNKILKTRFLDTAVTNADIVRECLDTYKRKYDIKQVNNVTTYLYKIGVLRGEMREMKTKDPLKKARKVWYYWKNPEYTP